MSNELSTKPGVDAAVASPDIEQRRREAPPRWLRIVGWLWFVNGAFGAVASAALGYGLAALCYAASGAMGLPPLWPWLKRKGFDWTVKRRTLFGASALVMAFIAGAPDRPTKSANMPRKSTSTAAEAGPAKPKRISTAERKKAEVEAGKAMERENKAKIASRLADVETLNERDYESRLDFWKEITALAPANTEYARKRDELAAQLKKLEYLRQSPELGMSVEKVAGRKEAFGNILIIDITLRNDALSNLKDFTITCESRGPSGTVTDTNTRVLYEIVDARKTKTFRKLNMGFVNKQATKLGCRVDAASIA